VEPIHIKDSYAIVPRTPGLGVELDAAAVAKYSV
jgi:L-alanine-DL-glutamate epimerase-like enolase superfamily enzyme